MGGIGGLARARVAAEREAEATGDHETLKEVMVKMWGWPWGDRRVGEDPLDVEALAARAEQGYELGTVPEGVHFLIVAIDVQYNRFVVQVEGFGVDRERWLIVDAVRRGEAAVRSRSVAGSRAPRRGLGCARGGGDREIVAAGRRSGPRHGLDDRA